MARAAVPAREASILNLGPKSCYYHRKGFTGKIVLMPRILIALMFCIFSTMAKADYITVASRVLCGNHKAIVQFAAGWNGEHIAFPDVTGSLAELFEDASEQPEMECDLGSAHNQRMFRAKLGEVQKYPWGRCGAAQRNFLSLWIAGRKIYSRKIVYDGCLEPAITRIDAVAYYDRTLLLCSYREPAIGGDADQSWVCLDVSEVYATGIKGEIDTVEYPTDGSQRPEGHIVLLISNERALCSIVFEQLALGRNFIQMMSDFPEDFTAVPWPWKAPILIEVDINNDGLPDLIRKDAEDMHGIDDAVVMVRDGRDRDALHSDPPESYDRRERYSGETLFPTPELDNAASPGSRDFSTSATPFIWQDETYVLMLANSVSSSPKWAIYQLQPDHSIKEVCVIDRVAINY